MQEKIAGYWLLVTGYPFLAFFGQSGKLTHTAAWHIILDSDLRDCTNSLWIHRRHMHLS